MSIIRKEQLTNPLSASYALTASYALNALTNTIDTGSFVTTSSFNAFTSSINQFTASYNTGSFSGSFTGSFNGTASWATNALTASYAKNAGTTIDTSSFATTGSNTFIGDQTITGSINFGDGSLIQSISASSGDGGGYTTLILKPDTSLASDQYIVLDPTTPNHIHIRAGGLIDSSSAYLYLGGEKANVVVQNLDYSFYEKHWVQINSQTGSTQNTWTFDDDGVLSAPGRINAPSFSGSFTGSLFGTASWAESASQAVSSSYTLTASYLNTLNQDLTLSGSLTILNNLTIFGTQSINYITSSQLDISTNIITVNTSTPVIRFGGIAVRDSGSLATGLTGSLLWDSEHNVWIYSNPSGAAYDGGLLLTGPRNTNGLGNEVGINSWYAAIGNGSHHMTSSAIYSSGSLIRLETNTQITGSLNVSAGITGSLASANVIGPFGSNSIIFASSADQANTANTLSTFASIDQINSGTGGVFIKTNELEQSKYATLNIYNYNNFT